MSQGLCPSCGAAVNLTAEQTETKCQYCDTPVSIQQAEAQFSAIQGSKVAGTLLIAQTSQEGGSYEEALNYYNKCIEQDPTFAEAWLNKGICLIRNSKIGDLKTAEAISSWRASVKFAKHPEEIKKRISKEIVGCVEGFWPVLDSHFKQFSTVDNAYAEHVGRFLKLESALAYALELSPKNPDVCVAGINLCEQVLGSASQAGWSNAASAALSKNWSGAITSAVGGMAQASAIKKPVEDLKYKYQKALSAIDPNFKAPESTGKEIDKTNTENLKTSLAATLKKPGGSLFGDLTGEGSKGSYVLYPETKNDKIQGKLLESIAFLGIKAAPDDCLFFEADTNLVITLDTIAWGEKAVTIFKKVISPEKKTVIQKQNVVEITYEAVGYFKDAKAPSIVTRNQYGVRQTDEIGTKFFKTQQYMYKANHERPQSFVQFLQAWKDISV